MRPARLVVAAILLVGAFLMLVVDSLSPSSFAGLLEDEVELAKRQEQYDRRQRELESMDVDSLVQLLGTDQQVTANGVSDVSANYQTESVIVQRRAETTLRLVAGLKSDNPRLRRHAVMLLGQIRDERTIPALIELGKVCNEDLSSTVIEALGNIGGPEVATFLIESLPQQSGGYSERVAVIVLGEIGDNRAIEPLLRILDNPRARWNRSVVVEALSRFRDPRVRTTFEKRLADEPDWTAYYAMKRGLAKIGTNLPGIHPVEGSLEADLRVVNKLPDPPEGLEAFLNKRSGVVTQGVYGVSMFCPQEEINRTRKRVLSYANNQGTDMIVEYLMDRYLCDDKAGDNSGARQTIVEIGIAAKPALEKGVERGSPILTKYCRECLSKIDAAESSLPDRPGRTE